MASPFNLTKKARFQVGVFFIAYSLIAGMAILSGARQAHSPILYGIIFGGIFAGVPAALGIALISGHVLKKKAIFASFVTKSRSVARNDRLSMTMDS